MSETGRQAAARVLAATLTLLAREMERLAPPFSLWAESLEADEIKQTAMSVAAGEAAVLWVDESHPARGLAIIRVMPLESAILGEGSLRIVGPWLVEPDPVERRQSARTIAVKARELSLKGGSKFVIVKTWHDPAILRGFIDEGFQVAEITSRFSGPIEETKLPEFPFLYHAGLAIRTPAPPEREKWLEALGELFYDGHYRHGPYLPQDFSARIWRQIILRDMKKQLPTVFLWDERQRCPVGLAMAAVGGPAADLTVVHINDDRRGEGLGRLLINELVRLMFQRGVTKLRAETACWNLPAVSLYSSLGLRPRVPLVALHLEV
ncbi:MAG: GNAT family N-acetyltransferase [Deltaproteobacteria bacterium]|jgi:ribosomal protein S18 acetylase RimI-like enzyme|nr:GNAT family N-acetyltransferase [Deltaproteobacteria bacterium]